MSSPLLRFVWLFLLVWSAAAHAQPLRLTELQASNIATRADEDGDFSDWLELHNPGPSPVPLAGYGLSDDPDDPFKWTFPSGALAPGGYLLVFASDKDRAPLVAHWETVIDEAFIWRYALNAAPPAAWTSPGFDDATWARGRTSIGYGDGDDRTPVPPSRTVHLRIPFTVEDPALIRAAVLHMDYDDGFVAYLNGVEIARANLEGTPPAPYAATDREATNYRGLPLDAFAVSNPAALLRAGENILAVQVHNHLATSSDLTALPLLTLGMEAPPPNAVGLGVLASSLAEAAFHTSFKLSGEGETLVLTAPGGAVVDRVPFGAIAADLSYGRDAVGTWAFFDVPTPGAANPPAGFAAVAEAPAVAPASGRFNGAAALAVTLTPAQPGDVLRYTRDGAEPTAASPVYSSPLTFTQTGVLRTRAFRDGSLPSPTVTHTYLLRESTTLPVVSLVTDPKNLWDEQTGIYVLGPNASPENPHFGANFWQDWEIPAHLELFERQATTPAFTAGAGVKIFGGWSRAHPQKSLAVFARSRYGTDAFDYLLHPDKPRLTSHQAFVLRNAGNDFYGTFFRDAMMQYLIKDAGVDMLAYRPTTLFLNGVYWGMQNLREKVNEHYLAANHPGVDPENIDLLEVVEAQYGEYEILEGSDEHFRALLAYVAAEPMTTEAHYAYVASQMDVEEYIDYMVAQIYYGNTDWPGNNVKLWRPRVPGGRWRWVLYDTDFGFGLYDPSAGYTHPTLAFAAASNGPNWPNPPHSTLLFRRLLVNPTFRDAFINRFADHLNATFQPARVHTQINTMANAIQPEVARHSARWSGALNGWSGQVETLRTFATLRPNQMWSQLRSYFALSALAATLTFNATPAEAGTVRVNRLDVTAFPWSGKYFPNVPLRVEAVPAPGYRFAGWAGASTDTTAVLTLAPRTGLSLTAQFVEDGGAAVGTAVLNELLYNPASDLPSEDWVELYNPGDASVDLAGYVFSDDDDTHRFALPAGTTLPARGFVVLCRDPAAFAAVYPAVPCVGPWGDFGLSSSGDVARFYDAGGALVDSLTFDDAAPWPTAPDGSGPTLELTDAALDNALASSWAASTVRGGTPGAANSAAVAAEGPGPRPLAFALHPNHPNPFREATTLSYERDRPGRTVLRLYDVLGRTVATLVDAHQPAGRYDVALDGAALASGVYVVRLDADTQTATRTLLRLR